MNKYELTFRDKIEKLRNQPFKEVLAFLKSGVFRSSRCTEIFWTSNLPVKWAQELSSLPNALEILFNYFSKPLCVNPAFLQKIAKIKSSVLIRAIKLSEAFKDEHQWDSFSFFKNNQNTDLRNLYKELDFLRNLNHDWEGKSKFYSRVIQSLDYEDILIHVISYFEKFKRSEQTIGNQSLITSHEVSLCYVLNELMNIKQNAIKASGEKIKNKYKTSEFKKVVQEVLPPLNTIEGILQKRYLPIESINSKKQDIRKAITFYFSYFATNYHVERYLCGYADFEFIDNWEAALKTNKSFAIHWRNDKKSWYQENLARNKALQKEEVKSYLFQEIETYKKQNFISIQTAMEYWGHLKLPLQTTANKDEIEFKQLFTFLYTFSNYLMPDGRIIGYSDENPKSPQFVMRRRKPEKFRYLFESDYLFVIEEEDLLENCFVYFGWNRQITKSLIDFLTSDLSSNDSYEIDFLSRPFFKISSQYIWPSSLLRNRRWEVLLHKRWMTEKLGNHQIQSFDLEKGIAENFRRAGFKARCSYKFHAGDKSGEIDTIAFKDNTLFIVELKTTYLHESLLRYGWYNTMRFEYKASDQLKKIQSFIQANFETFKKIPELEIDCELRDLKIFPLIVSNIFEYDDYFSYQEYRKVSLFELLVILNNDLYDTLNSNTGSLVGVEEIDRSFATVLQSFNRLAPHFKKEELKRFNQEECNLWTQTDGCSPQDLIEAIDQKKIWKGLDEMMGFDFGELTEIGRFN